MLYDFYYNNKDYQIEMNETTGLRIEVMPRPSSIEQLVEIQIAFLEKFKSGQAKEIKPETKIEIEPVQNLQQETLQSSVIPVDFETINKPALGKLLGFTFAVTTAWVTASAAYVSGNLPTLALSLLFFAGVYWLFKAKNSHGILTDYTADKSVKQEKSKEEKQQIKADIPKEMPKFVGKKNWSELKLFEDRKNLGKLYNYQNTVSGMETFLKNAGYTLSELDLISEKVNLKQ